MHKQGKRWHIVSVMKAAHCCRDGKYAPHHRPVDFHSACTDATDKGNGFYQEETLLCI